LELRRVGRDFFGKQQPDGLAEERRLSRTPDAGDYDDRAGYQVSPGGIGIRSAFPPGIGRPADPSRLPGSELFEEYCHGSV
jgi:hypothetical protein